MTEKKAFRNYMLGSGLLFVLFLDIILAVKTIDVQAIGPLNSEIGLATINGAVRDLFGFNMGVYRITEVTGVIAILIALCFALLGMYQLLSRWRAQRVDKDIIILGIFYVIVVIFYAIFEVVVINYRPVILESELEASFPSSHTMLSVFIMSSAIHQFWHRIDKSWLRWIAVILCALLLVVTVCGRMISGVHWFTDILGGLALSFSLVLAYIGFCKIYSRME